MTEYLGTKVPLGGEKVTDFTTERLDAPTEPDAVEIEWRDPAGIVQETDTLIGGVYRPAGSTAENDPGHFRAKRLVGAAEAVQAGYKAYGRWRDAPAAEWSPWIFIEEYEVVPSVLGIEQGAATLATVNDVRDYYAHLSEVDLPPGVTDSRIQQLLEDAHALALSTLGVTSTSDLTAQQQVVGRGAVKRLAALELLFALGDKNPDSARVIDAQRKRIFADLEVARAVNPKTRRRRFGIKGV